MSHPTSDYTGLLREAVKQAIANAPRAEDDLRRCASQAAEAVTNVTGGAAALELVPINQVEKAHPAYQLQLRKVGSEAPPSDLGVYSLTAAGYPVLRWYSRWSWGEQPDAPGNQFPNVQELEEHFKWLLSKPESRLVVLVTFFQQQATLSRG